MILDSSAILSIQLRETGCEALLEKILAAKSVFVGAPTVLESILAMSSRLAGRDARPVILGFLRNVGAEVIDFTPEHLEAAAEAFLRFGKGRHPAALSYGDCMAYAYSAVSGYPLLFTGTDFSRTDIAAA